jgi:hypothetical protein
MDSTDSTRISSEVAQPPVSDVVSFLKSIEIEKKTFEMLMMQVACLKEDVARRDKCIKELEKQVRAFSSKLAAGYASDRKQQTGGLLKETCDFEKLSLKPEAIQILRFLSRHRKITASADAKLISWVTEPQPLTPFTLSVEMFDFCWDGWQRVSYDIFMGHFCLLESLGLTGQNGLHVDPEEDTGIHEFYPPGSSIWITPKGRIFLLKHEAAADQKATTS